MLIGSTAKIQILDLQPSPPDHEIVADHDARDRAEESSIAAQPSQDKRPVVREQFPRHHSDAHEAGDNSSRTKADSPWPQDGEVIGGRHDVSPDVYVESRQHNRNQRDDN